MSFQVSDKVVCVDDSNQLNPTAPFGGDLVKKGVVYVVRGHSSKGGPYLVGMFAGFWRTGEEVSYKANRFRKLSEIKAENAAKASIKQEGRV